MTERYSEEDCIEALEAAARDLEKTPTMREYREGPYEPSSKTIQSRFGTWNQALAAAGLTPNKRGRRASTPIDVSYFEEIDSPEEAYWLGTLYAADPLQRMNEQTVFQIGRSKKKRFFVEGFAEAVGSEYAIHESQSTANVILTHVSNREFIETLQDRGFSLEGPPGRFPDLGPLQGAFFRGFLEASGYFSSGGWNITLSSEEKADQLDRWVRNVGVKQTTVSEDQRGRSRLRISNPFDVAAVFEACWPDALDTRPSFEPYPRKVIAHLKAEHPYPENLAYLDEA